MKASRRLGLLAIGAVATVAAAALWFFQGGQTIEVVRAAIGELDEVVRGPARVRARVPVTLGARVVAAVVAVEVDIGDPVRKGQPLVRLDDRDLRFRVAAAQAALTRAQADLTLAESNERRDREVYARGHISKAALDVTTAQRSVKRAEVVAAEQELAYAETQASYALLTSPMDAILVARLAEPGDTVAPGTPILRLVDPKTLQAVARIDEAVAGGIRPGMPARVRLRTGGEASGKVARVLLEADPVARELTVEIDFDTPPEHFAIDQEAEVSIEVGRVKGIVIPLSALIRLDGRPGVLVVRDGRVRFQPIEAGANNAGRLIVGRGIEAGDLIVRKAQQVAPGSRVRVPEGG